MGGNIFVIIAFICLVIIYYLSIYSFPFSFLLLPFFSFFFPFSFFNTFMFSSNQKITIQCNNHNSQDTIYTFIESSFHFFIIIIILIIIIIIIIVILFFFFSFFHSFLLLLP